MPRHRRRKIEVPTDTQPQFELGYTAEDIERRRREREEKEDRETREMEERERERVETEMIEVSEEAEETEDREEKRPRTDTDTEYTQSRQKKGQNSLSDLRFNVPDMASSPRPSQTKLQPRTLRDRPG